MPKTTTASKKKKTPAPKAPAARMSASAVMKALEKAGTAQARKTYLRHGVTDATFGVSFATLKQMYNKIKVDQELAEALWKTGNFDARNLALKIADPAGISSKELDKWAATPTARMCCGYVARLAAEGPHGVAKAGAWLKSKDEALRSSGWTLVGALAQVDETLPDAWFTARLGEIEKGMAKASNTDRYLMNNALIAIGGRNAALRKAALAAAKRIGPVDVDHGDTSCQTPEAQEYIAKMWERAKAGGYDSPSAHERSRESMRTRC